MFLHPATQCRKYATAGRCRPSCAGRSPPPPPPLLFHPARYITCTRVILVDRFLISAQEVSHVTPPPQTR